MNETQASIPRPKILPPIYLLLAILLMLALHWWLPGARLLRGGWRWVGGVVIVAALGMNIGCALQFRLRKTTIIPFHESDALLTTGLYRVTRNPIYLCMFELLAGVAIALGTLTPWLVIPIFIWIIATKFVRREEAMLIETFGENYDAYCRRVRRWL